MSEIIKNIEKGKWQVLDDSENDGNIYVGINVKKDFGEEIIRIESCEMSYMKDIAHARLIADAGTTANLCKKLPSELLSYNKELEHMVQSLISQNKELSEGNKEVLDMIKDVRTHFIDKEATPAKVLEEIDRLIQKHTK